MDNSFDFMALLTLLKRASHSGYKTFVMSNRMIMNCYNLDSDSDIGVHYILHIPDVAPHDSPFFNLRIDIDYLTVYNETKDVIKEFEKERKKRKIRPKEASIIGYYEMNDSYLRIMIKFKLLDEEWKTVFIRIPQHGNEQDNIEYTYELMIGRIDADGEVYQFDGLREGIKDKACNNPRVYYHPVQIGEKTIRLPFMRSSFRTLTKIDEFTITIRKTNLKKVYLVTHSFMAKGLLDQYIMYVEDFG